MYWRGQEREEGERGSHRLSRPFGRRTWEAEITRGNFDA